MTNDEYYIHEDFFKEPLYSDDLPKKGTNMDRLLDLLPKKPYWIENTNLIRLFPSSSIRFLVTKGICSGWIRAKTKNGKSYYQRKEKNEEKK